jgi:hypothetical protein
MSSRAVEPAASTVAWDASAFASSVSSMTHSPNQNTALDAMIEHGRKLAFRFDLCGQPAPGCVAMRTNPIPLAMAINR